DMGAHHVLQTTRNPPINAPRIRRSKNGSHASVALCPKVPGLHIAKSCSGSPHPARPTTRIRARQKRLQRLSRHSDISDCSERSAKKERSDPEQCSNFIEPRIRGVEYRARLLTSLPPKRQGSRNYYDRSPPECRLLCGWIEHANLAIVRTG